MYVMVRWFTIGEGCHRTRTRDLGTGGAPYLVSKSLYVHVYVVCVIFGRIRMVALVTKGGDTTTRTELRLRDLGHIW